MDLASALNDLREIPSHGLREGAHILRGIARAAGIAAHNNLVFPFVFPLETRVKANDAEEHALRRHLIALFEADWRNVQEGIYPASLAQEFDWAKLLRLYPRLILDAPRMRKRVHSNDFE